MVWRWRRTRVILILHVVVNVHDIIWQIDENCPNRFPKMVVGWYPDKLIVTFYPCRRPTSYRANQCSWYPTDMTRYNHIDYVDTASPKSCARNPHETVKSPHFHLPCISWNCIQKFIFHAKILYIMINECLVQPGHSWWVAFWNHKEHAINSSFQTYWLVTNQR